MTKRSVSHYDLRETFPSLHELGIAAEYFPAYSHRESARRITHDVLYCSLLLSGTATHWLDDEATTEGPGTLTVVGYDTAHLIVTEKQPVEVFNLYLDPARHALPHVGAALRPALSALLPLHPGLMHRQNRLQRIVLRDPQRTAQWMHALQTEQSLKCEGSAEAILALGQLILTDLARAAFQVAPQSPMLNNTDTAMESIRKKLDEDFAEEQSIEDYARLAKLSREQFSRRFTRHVGCPPVTYRRQRRLHAAMDALRENDDSIASIAFGCGFVDLAHFNRSFKALAHCTPRAYRERFRG